MAKLKKPLFVAYTRIKSIADARKVFGISKNFKPDVSMWPEFMQANKLIEFDLQLVIAAINGKWIPDWTNKSERKYYPWWWINEVSEGGVSGRGLSLGAVDCDDSDAYVGPRHVFQTNKKARHAVRYFKPLFEQYYFTK